LEAVVTATLKPRIQVVSDLEAMSHKAAEMFVNSSRTCMASQGKFSVAISGGSTPRRLYTLLGSNPYREEVNWLLVHFFWVDERCVPKEHEESNFKAAFDTLLSKISIPDENIHRIMGEGAPDKAARDYEEEVRKSFGMSGLPMFDLVILGMGEDGHTASLFPGSSLLKERIRLAAPVYLERPNRNRITLTLPVLNNATQILFLIAGHSKADVVYEILGNERKKERYPAGLIRPVHGAMTWLIDQEAAKKLGATEAA
jgi:6-phosphogluconolactonase